MFREGVISLGKPRICAGFIDEELTGGMNDLGTAARGAKLPFVGMSAHGGKADFPVARPDF
jgi:hypothetical protein